MDDADAAAPGATLLSDGALGEVEGLADDAVVFGRYARDGHYAPEIIELLLDLLAGDARTGTLLDVGAHIGLVSLGVAQRSAASCLAFEPAPSNAALLARNVARHGLESRIEVHACALDEVAGTGVLELSRDNSGDHRLASKAPRGADASIRGVEVPARTLDDLLRGRTLAKPIVLKLDTQGGEARVLRGGAATLPSIRHAVIEYWPFGQHRMGEDAFALDALLSSSFPYASVIEGGQVPQRLSPTARELERLRWIARDGSDRGFFDLLLSRDAEPRARR
jgi:FkbM family methyltransferase